MNSSFSVMAIFLSTLAPRLYSAQANDNTLLQACHGNDREYRDLIEPTILRTSTKWFLIITALKEAIAIFFFDDDEKNEEVVQYSEQTFESIKHINENGQEYWLARDLMPVLEYGQWRRFNEAIDRAKLACQKSGNEISDHFADVGKTINMPKGAHRTIPDYMLSRYACYLLVMNGDPRKEIIALGQTYFAVKTRQQELIENYETLTEDQKRLSIRREMKEHNKSLAEAAQMAGVMEGRDYAIFQNSGYKGLYGGLTAKDIHARKGLKKSQDILDHMGSTELAANLFRATQTDEKLRRENIRGKEAANRTHFKVGKKVRQTIRDLGGTMPEDLPTPDKSIKQIEKEQKKKELDQ